MHEMADTSILNAGYSRAWRAQTFSFGGAVAFIDTSGWKKFALASKRDMRFQCFGDTLTSKGVKTGWSMQPYSTRCFEISP